LADRPAKISGMAPTSRPADTVDIVPLTPDRWDDVAALFGEGRSQVALPERAAAFGRPATAPTEEARVT
jgi:hypothetical protein